MGGSFNDKQFLLISIKSSYFNSILDELLLIFPREYLIKNNSKTCITAILSRALVCVDPFRLSEKLIQGKLI